MANVRTGVQANEAPKAAQEETWSVQEVPTQTSPMVVNTLEGQAYPPEVVQAKILNLLEKIAKILES